MARRASVSQLALERSQAGLDPEMVWRLRLADLQQERGPDGVPAWEEFALLDNIISAECGRLEWDNAFTSCGRGISMTQRLPGNDGISRHADMLNRQGLMMLVQLRTRQALALFGKIHRRAVRGARGWRGYTRRVQQLSAGIQRMLWWDR